MQDLKLTDIISGPLSLLLRMIEFSDMVSLKKTCRHFNNLFSQNTSIQKIMYESYIKKFISHNPRIVEQLSNPKVFLKLKRDLIEPYRAQFFDPNNQPKGYIKRVPLIQGEYSGKNLENICIANGYETLHLYLIAYDHARNYNLQEYYPVTLEDILYQEIYWDKQISIVCDSVAPAYMLINMSKRVHPFLYFLGLGAALVIGRVDVFREMLAEFDTMKELAHASCHVRYDATNNLIGISKPRKNDTAIDAQIELSLDNIEQWSMWFKDEYDGVPLSVYAAKGDCLEAYEQCLKELKLEHAAIDTCHR